MNRKTERKLRALGIGIALGGGAAGVSGCGFWQISEQTKTPDYQQTAVLGNSTRVALEASATAQAKEYQDLATKVSVEKAISQSVNQTVEARQGAGQKETPPSQKTEAVAATRVSPSPEVTCNLITTEVSDRKFYLKGIPTKMDGSRVLTVEKVRGLTPNANFQNTIGLGSEMMLAEPGMLADPKTFTTPEESPFIFDSGRGGFTLVALQEGAIEFPQMGKTIGLGEWQNSMWIVVIREKYLDPGTTNLRLDLNCIVPFHAQVQKFAPGSFVSEGQLRQIAETAHTAKNLEGKPNDNCGGAGCKGLNVVMYDSNTDALTIIHQDGVGGQWVQVFTNWE